MKIYMHPNLMEHFTKAVKSYPTTLGDQLLGIPVMTSEFMEENQMIFTEMTPEEARILKEIKAKMEKENK